METLFYRNVLYYDSYYFRFFSTLPPKVQLKFNWTIQLIATQERISEKFFKHLSGTSGLYEIRIEHGSNQYRLFSFFDEGQLIIIINGFQKKSKKTPHREIKLAEQIKKQYYHEKENT